MNQRKIILTFAIILLAVSILMLIFPHDNKLELTAQAQSLFTIHLYGDFTSSGGSRYYNSTLVFEDSMLISGSESYETWPGSGGHNLIDCILDIDSLTWIVKEKIGELNCDSIPDYAPLDLSEIKQKIDSGEFKTSRDCRHAEICYEIVE